jgi:hypothetical protein
MSGFPFRDAPFRRATLRERGIEEMQPKREETIGEESLSNYRGKRVIAIYGSKLPPYLLKKVRMAACYLAGGLAL